MQRRPEPAPSLPFFFNDTATTEIYTLSLHDALPIYAPDRGYSRDQFFDAIAQENWRSEEHTSELQSQSNIVCRLLLEKQKGRSRAQAAARSLYCSTYWTHPGHLNLTHDLLLRHERLD